MKQIFTFYYKCLHACGRIVLPMLIGINAPLALAQESEAAALRAQYAWQSKSKILEKLGEPLNRSDPIGTFAQYERWEYENLSVVFADGHVIHVFSKDSLTKSVELSDQ